MAKSLAQKAKRLFVLQENKLFLTLNILALAARPSFFVFSQQESFTAFRAGTIFCFSTFVHLMS